MVVRENGKGIWRLWIVGILTVLVTGCTLLLQPPVATSPHLLLGNPSNAAANPNSADNYLMLKPQYALSYNNSKHRPNWVSWQLNRDWLGSVPRRNDFRPDESLPSEWYAVTPSDYNNSGFDRGHLVPAADRTRTVADNSATFLMTNILPQAPDNNQGPWAELENYCRGLVRRGRELYIIAGGYGTKRAIGDEKIAAPSHVWKVIVILEQPSQGLVGIRSETRVIAVDMPNNQGIRNTPWQDFQVSIDHIESKTGYDLLSAVPEPIQAVLESKVSRAFIGS